MSTATEERSTPARVTRRRLLGGGGLLALLGYAWVASGFRPFTWPATVVTGIAGLTVVAVSFRNQVERQPVRHWWAGLRHHVGRRREPRERLLDARTGLRVWLVVVLVLIAWEVIELFQTPRSKHPTLSSLVDSATAHRGPHFVLYAVWLLAGVFIARR